MIRSALLAPTALLLVALAGTACESTTAGDDPTPVQTWKITPAATGRPAAPPTIAPTVALTPQPAGTTLSIAAVGSVFDVESFEAPAGVIMIEFDNRDAGVLHNIHVFRGDDATGEDMGATELEVGPLVQTLQLTLEPGTYYIVCDAHPTTMQGTLVVQ
ncbi:MAG: cupredoxin domain-containing protein [Dehalococcoidia bacterium]